MMIFPWMLLVVSVALVLVQFLAAVPWLWVLNVDLLRRWWPRATLQEVLRRVAAGLGLLGLGGVALALWLGFFVREPENLQFWGGAFGALLQGQLILDLFAVVFPLLLLVWPKGGAVALASFRECLRHPMFWFIFVLALLLLLTMPIVPYFTFGEDFKMVKDLGYSTILLAAGGFGVLAASMLISEEIEGRTAITLMSKPVSRRQFLIGKFVGLLLSALAMTGALSLVFDGVLVFKVWYDKDPVPVPPWLTAALPGWTARVGEMSANFLAGNVWWFQHAGNALPGVILGFCEVMVLLAIAVALATRVPMIVNLNSCLVIFFLGNLTPVLVQVSQKQFPLVRFVAQLFDTLLPSLEFFNLGPAIARDVPPDPGPFAFYLGSVVLYSLLYTTIALLVGLILFEDRDLA